MTSPPRCRSSPSTTAWSPPPIGLQGRADADRLRIDYWVNDALQQVDAGHIDLTRATAASVRRPSTDDGDD